MEKKTKKVILASFVVAAIALVVINEAIKQDLFGGSFWIALGYSILGIFTAAGIYCFAKKRWKLGAVFIVIGPILTAIIIPIGLPGL